MNKITAILCAFALMGAANAQRTIGLVKGSEAVFYVDENLPDGFKSCKISFYNKTNSDMIINYRKIKLDFPSSWMISFCDNRDCLPNFPESGSYAKIKPGDTTDMKLDVFPIGSADSAVIQYAIWDQNRPNDVDTLIYNVYARWGLNIQSVSGNATRVYPNPVSGQELQLVGSNLQEVRVFSTDGRLLFESQAATGNQFTVPMRAMPNGTYLIEVTHAGGTDTHKVQLAR
jgi:hypothetical protein